MFFERTVLLIIKSVCSVKNQLHRNAIRKTWANSTYIASNKLNVTVDRVFSLGNCELEHAQTSLASEHTQGRNSLHTMHTLHTIQRGN